MLELVETGDLQKNKQIINNCISLKNNRLSINDCLIEVNKIAIRKLLIAILREKLLPYYYCEGDLFFFLPRFGAILFLQNAKLATLLRVIHFEHLYLVHNHNETQQIITNPLQLLDIIKIELKGTIKVQEWQKFHAEFANHLQNSIFALWRKYDVSLNKTVNAYSPSHQFLNPPKNIAHYTLQFEQSVFNGHPYHPCAKTKLGFTIEDVLHYSPEFQSDIDIYIVAVKKRYTHIESMKAGVDFNHWFASSYPCAWLAWQESLTKKNLKIEDYVPFPIHPWQVYYFTFIEPNLLSRYIKAKTIVLLEDVKVTSSPTLSFRTLLPKNENNPAYIKLPVAIQATSVFRTLSAVSTLNVPKISRTLQAILEKENYFSGRLSVLPELYGLHLPALQENKSQNFSAIFRENIAISLQSGEVAVVIASFFEQGIDQKNNLFIELMQLAGYTTYQEALSYFHHYVDLVLGGYLNLYLLYGVALEGHQQNTFAVFQKGKLTRFIARDLEGIRIHPQTLNARGFDLDIAENSPQIKSDRALVRNNLLYSVYQLHLGEIILLITDHFGCAEDAFWQIIKKVTLQTLMYLKNQLDESLWKAEYNAILVSDWPLKALLRMRLNKNIPEGILFNSIANPFASLCAS